MTKALSKLFKCLVQISTCNNTPITIKEDTNKKYRKTTRDIRYMLVNADIYRLTYSAF